jgi:hypothetical protein
MKVRSLATVVLAVMNVALPGAALGAQFQAGDIFAAVGDADLDGQSEIFHYRADGTFVEALAFGPDIGGRSTGMAFDESGNLLATAFDASKIVRFDARGHNLGVYIDSGLSFPESIVFDEQGDFYVSSVLSPVGIQKFDAQGKRLAVLLPGTRVDWMDLVDRQRTILFTQESRAVRCVEVSTGAQRERFAATGGICFALRALPDGSVLVANGADIKLFSSAGELVRTYDLPEQDVWFAVNLDPDGTSFWSGDIDTGELYKFDIDCGGAVNCTTFTQMIATGVPNERPTRGLAGLAIYGELTAARPSPAVPVQIDRAGRDDLSTELSPSTVW